MKTSISLEKVNQHSDSVWGDNNSHHSTGLLCGGRRGETSYRANVRAQGLERLEELLVGAHDGEIDQRVLCGTSKTKRVREIGEASKTE